ncbi:unnamed protein product [Phytophthora lilii]|uniref:Unnamed protein product n=1 Tax=Phytophthora lilii TaxID=2077276 RepID=A0A9W6WPJ6_9STRA|nr:unnamed protein product [Phytophthora lilii]
MLLPILTSGQHVLEGGDLSFQYDTQPIAPSSDRHASKLVRKRAKRRKQSSAAAVKISIYGSYAASRASSRTESRFGGSRFGGSRASASVRGTGLASKMPKMSLIYGLNSGGESLMNSSWIGSQQGSTDTASNNVSWLQGGGPNVKNSSPPASISGTARVAVDFVELQRRAGIERDLNTRDSLRRSHDEFNRKNDIRLKLRSLADPTVSLEKEEAMLAALGAKGQRFRLQHGRQGTRGKTPGIPPTNLSPLDGKRRGLTPSAPATDETTTFRTEDYEGLASDVVLFSKGGELVIGENCFVVEQKLRQELLLDLQTRGVVQPRIQLVTTPKPDEEITSGENSPSNPQQSRASPPPLRPPGALPPPKQELPSHGSAFGDQIGSFESSPSLALDLEAAPLAKGVILKLPDTAATRALASKTRNGAPKKVSKKAPISESVPNANLEKQLNAMIKAPEASKPALTMSHSDSVLQTNKALSTAASPLTSGSSTKSSQANNAAGAGSPVLPKHIVSITESSEVILKHILTWGLHAFSTTVRSTFRAYEYGLQPVRIDCRARHPPGLVCISTGTSMAGTVTPLKISSPFTRFVCVRSPAESKIRCEY